MLEYTWHAHWNGYNWYALSYINGELVYLHRFLLNLQSGDEYVDHVNGNGLDCRDENMRLATQSQNLANQPKFAGRYTSRYKGVSWYKASGKWAACIRIDYKTKHLGYFVDEEDAARAYDEAAWSAWGEFAVLNFPREGVLTIA